MKGKILLGLTAILMLTGAAVPVKADDVWKFDAQRFVLKEYTGTETDVVVPEISWTVTVMCMNRFVTRSKKAIRNLRIYRRKIKCFFQFIRISTILGPILLFQEIC